LPILVKSIFETKYFHQHSYSYCVERKEPPQICVTTSQSLVDYHTLDGIRQNGTVHLRMKYCVIELKKSQGLI
jgi:hypothetical protein